MGNEQGKPELSPEELKDREIQKIDKDIKRKLVRVLIKGDRNTGKTCLMKRLQAQPFVDAYIPSESISTCHIKWDYKNSDDLVLVEVWDVVDQAKDKTRDLHLSDEEDEISSSQKQLEKNIGKVKEQLKPSTPTQPGSFKEGSHRLSILDASLIDVYKGAVATILIFDITKKWTFDYCKQEVKKIPENIEIVILANFKDLEDKRVVTKNEIDLFITNSKRKIYCIETCLKNMYGLKQLHTYLNVPFTRHRIEETKKTISKLQEDYDIASLEVNLNIKEQNYSKYLTWLKETRSRPQIFESQPVNPPIKVNNPQIPQNVVKLGPVPTKVVKKIIEEDSEDDLNASTAVTSQTTSQTLKSEDSSDDDKKKKKKKSTKTIPVEKKTPILKPPLEEKVEDDFFDDKVEITKDVDVGNLDKGFYDDDDDEEDSKDKKSQLQKDSTEIVLDDMKDSEEEEEPVKKTIPTPVQVIPKPVNTKIPVKNESEEESEEEKPKTNPVVVDSSELVLDDMKDSEDEEVQVKPTKSSPFMLPKSEKPVVQTIVEVVQTAEKSEEEVPKKKKMVKKKVTGTPTTPVEGEKKKKKLSEMTPEEKEARKTRLKKKNSGFEPI